MMMLLLLGFSSSGSAADLTGMWDVTVSMRGGEPTTSQRLIVQDGDKFTYEFFPGTVVNGTYTVEKPFPGRIDIKRAWIEFDRFEFTENGENKIKGNVFISVYRTSKAPQKVTSMTGKMFGARIMDPSPRVLPKGGNEIWVKVGAPFEDPGVLAHDGVGKNLADRVVVNSTVDTQKPGDYTITYNVTDDQGKKSPEMKRLVHVVTPAPPTVKVRGDELTTVAKGTLYSDLGANAMDYLHKDISDKIKITVNGKEADPSSPAAVNTQKAGETYEITYAVQDENGKNQATRKVEVAGSEDEQSFWSYCFISTILP